MHDQHAGHGGHGHQHGHGGQGAARALGLVLLLTLLFAALEAAAGWWTGSLALLADAGHMLSDSLSLGLAWLAQRLSQRPVSHQYSYGLGRLEPFAALINALLMLAVIAGISWEAVQRFSNPQPVMGGWMLLVACGGLLVNILAARLLWHDHGNLNMRAALLHVVGDLLGSLAAIIAALVILFTGWQAIDPLLSLLVSGLILFSSVRLLLASTHVLLDGTPPHLRLSEIGQALASVPGVRQVHDLHVWQLDSQRISLSAHLRIADLRQWPRQLLECRRLLQERFSIEHITLQPELALPERDWQHAIAIMPQDAASGGQAHKDGA